MRLRGLPLAVALEADVFAKVGDSITASPDFLTCFGGDDVDLAADGYDALEPTRLHFLAGDAAGTSPFERSSLASRVGASADWARRGDPSPLDEELAALRPRYAVVMFGTNDLWRGGGPEPVEAKYRGYHEHLAGIVDALLGRGVVPLLSTIPPHRGTPDWIGPLVPTLNAIVVGIAEERQVPVMGLHEVLLGAPGAGLGPDGVHPNRLAHGAACDLSPEGLKHGYNLRNLLTLEALDRVHRAVSGAADALPSTLLPLLSGDGSLRAPFVIPGLPFTAARSRLSSSARHIPSCVLSSDVSVRATAYRLRVETPTPVRLLALQRGPGHPQLEALLEVNGELRCRGTGGLLQGTLSAGDWTFMVSPASDGEEPALFVASLCAPDDPRCAPSL